MPSYQLLSTDKNECETETPCDENADCLNNEGSFTCTCKAGYDGAGVGADSCAGKL